MYEYYRFCAMRFLSCSNPVAPLWLPRFWWLSSSSGSCTLVVVSHPFVLFLPFRSGWPMLCSAGPVFSWSARVCFCCFFSAFCVTGFVPGVWSFVFSSVVVVLSLMALLVLHFVVGSCCFCQLGLASFSWWGWFWGLVKRWKPGF
jgi:hypothetical protein